MTLSYNPAPSNPLLERARPASFFRRKSLSNSALSYFEKVMASKGQHRKMNSYYSQTLAYLRKIIPSDQKVLLVGGLTSTLLERLNVSYGVGIDANAQFVKLAKEFSENRNIHYLCGLPEDFSDNAILKNVAFDYVLILNVIDHSQDISVLIESLKPFIKEDTKVIFSMLNPLWHGLIRAASKLHIRIPDYERNLIGIELLKTTLERKKFKVMDITKRILFPKNFGAVSFFFNQWLAKVPGLNHFCFNQFVTAKLHEIQVSKSPTCTVLIPCFNEEENIQECIDRVPSMGSYTEIVVINDGSKDKTEQKVRDLMPFYPNLRLISYSPNEGKGNAVLKGMKASKGDILMILDADMTVPPEELVDFYEALATKTADFASGNRFLYPMEKEAMRFANYLGNIVFSWLVQIIVGSPYSDTLCGTKAMFRKDFTDFKIEDKAWGDFDLIFFAANLKLKCIQIPVHYLSRVRGESKMKAFSAGIKFLKLCLNKWAVLP